MKKSLIIGITGQDGYYLSKQLLESGHKVYGVYRRSSQNTTSHLSDNPNLVLIEGDITDPHSMNKVIDDIKPDYCYILAAQSHVQTSFEEPTYTAIVNLIGPGNVYESIRRFSPKTRIYFAATSEMFGSCWSQESLAATTESLSSDPFIRKNVYNNSPKILLRTEHQKAPTTDFERSQAFQDEQTQMLPNSPYAVAKLATYNLSRVYRDSYGLFISCGILFNHESEMRGDKFVTRKISKYIGKFINAKKNNKEIEKLKLGNINSRRDFGFAGDYTNAMRLMLEYDIPDDFVIATGETHTIHDFLRLSLNAAGLDGDKWEDYIEIDKEFIRPSEVAFLRGRPTKAVVTLKWQTKLSFEDLVFNMVKNDIELENAKN